MDRETALRKIKSCLALASSSNPNEAATAMRQAQKLMAAFGLNEGDVQLSDVNEARAPGQTKKHAKWEAVLAHAISNAFGVEHFFTRYVSHWIESGRVYKAEVVFVGVGSAPEIASYAWSVLARQCAKSRLEHIRKQPGRCKPATLTARGDSFAMGWVHGVNSNLVKFAGNDQQRELIERYLAAEHPNMTSFVPADRTKGRNVSNNDLFSGYLKGKEAEINQGVASGPQMGLLEGV